MYLAHTLMAAAVSGILAGAAGCGGTAPQPAEPSAGDMSGMSAPAAASAKHACKGQNECKGQGGCKTDKNGCKGQNACKGQGGCKTA